MIKKALFVFLIFSSFVAYSQVVPKRPVPSEFSWRILQEAQVAFENNNYSEAMNLANKAKENRKAESDWEFYILDTSLSPLAVRKAGTDFDDVLKVLKERDENEAIALINKYLDLYGRERFKNSVTEMVNWLKEKSVYPEADFLIGRIYQIEGEYDTAYAFYEKARLGKNFLDIPDELLNILYSISELAKITGKPEEYEQSLILILANDPDFNNSVLQRAVIKIVDANKVDNVDRFFELFRAESPATLRALYDISDIYLNRSERNNALYSFALCSIEAFTHMFNSVCERDSDYTYVGFADFIEKCSRYDEILDWAEDNHVWKSFLVFAELCAERGCVDFANKIFIDIYKYAPSKYWQAEALNKIIDRNQ